VFRVACTVAYPITVVLIYRGVDLTVLSLDVATKAEKDVSVGVKWPEAALPRQPMRNLTTVPTPMNQPYIRMPIMEKPFSSHL